MCVLKYVHTMLLLLCSTLHGRQHVKNVFELKKMYFTKQTKKKNINRRELSSTPDKSPPFATILRVYTCVLAYHCITAVFNNFGAPVARIIYFLPTYYVIIYKHTLHQRRIGALKNTYYSGPGFGHNHRYLFPGHSELFSLCGFFFYSRCKFCAHKQ